jgi:hypothetical protein
VAKAVKQAATYGTAEAVPFLQIIFPLMRARLSRSIEYEVILAPAASDRVLRIRAEVPACRGSSIRVSEQARIMT